MQPMVTDEPYQFVPPVRGRAWPSILKYIVPWFVNRTYGVTDVEFRGLEHLQASIDAGRGILVAPNHCRPADPMVIGLQSRTTGRFMYAMATWNLFREGAFQRFMIRRLGAFSVYREGIDRASMKEAIADLAEGDRMLLLFPEGIVARTNDRVLPLLEGTGFIAGQAAKKREGPIAVHPAAIRYFFTGDDAALRASAIPIIERLEQRFVMHTNTNLSLYERIARIDAMLVTAKEVEHFGAPESGCIAQRRAALVERLLGPLEKKWNGGRTEGRLALRVKLLRTNILADMTAGKVDAEEKRLRWQDLARVYDAQRISNHPPGYCTPEAPRERVLETIERLEEDAYDKASTHRPWKAVIQFAPAVEITAARTDEAELAKALHASIQGMIDALASESRPLGV